MSTATADATEKRLYKSTIKFNNVVFPDGTVAHFKFGLYTTNDESQIKYFDEQITRNGFGGIIFIDPNARTMTAEQENPLLALRKKFFEEFQREQAAQIDPSNDMGESKQGKLNAASTSDIASVALGGDGAAGLRAAVAVRNK